MKFLIVDDDLMARMVLQRYLSSFAECHTVINGDEAVDAFKMALSEGDPYDIIFMDIMMPVKDGHRALEEIRSIEKDLDTPPDKEAKIIVVSSLSDPRTVIRAYKEGYVTDYITKPIDLKKLYEKLKGIGVL